MFVEPSMKREKQVQENLTKTITKMRSDLVVGTIGEDEEDDDSLPYVCIKFTVAGGN